MAEAKSLGYPAFIIAGIIIPPIAATVAGLDPDIAPKNAEAIIVIIPRPPIVLPTQALANLIKRPEIPPLSISPPANIKKGIAMKGNESTDVNILCATTKAGVGISPKVNAIMEDNPNDTAIGIFNKSNMNKLPNNKRTIKLPSLLIVLRLGYFYK
jgi:hypothetical protein